MAKEMLQARSNTHFSFNLWTLNNFIAFAAIVTYYIDDNGQLQIILISFCQIIGFHSGEEIVEQVVSLIQEYGIEKKLRYFVLDNTTSNNTCIEAILKAI